MVAVGWEMEPILSENTQTDKYHKQLFMIINFMRSLKCRKGGAEWRGVIITVRNLCVIAVSIVLEIFCSHAILVQLNNDSR